MIGTTDQQVAQVGRTRQFDTLRRLLAIGATDLGTALNQASQLVAEVLSADKVDVFLLDASGTELTALGVSDTPMGRLERQIGLDHLALADGGRAVDVFQTGAPYRHGHADQDPGEIAPEVLPRLFTRFGAGPGSTGLGLGLFLARGIAEAHRGTLTAQSTPGDGASFVLSLPIAQARESEPVG